jgi:alkylated DNA repair dioxygenase AlkB
MINDLFTSQEDLPPFDLPNTDDYSWVWNEDMNGYDIQIPNGELFYSENFFNNKICTRSIEYFLENDMGLSQDTNWREFSEDKLNTVNFKNINWRHDKLNMYGKVVYLPRYSAWYGDNDKPYTYSGLTLLPNEWNKGLLYLKKEIEKTVDIKFNSVLMNWYRDGHDYLNWHTDAEKELGQNPVIGSVNFGASRDFLIRNNKDNTMKLTIPLKNGTLLIMKGELQHYWQHSVPKRAKVKDVRFNLTFREIKNLL